MRPGKVTVPVRLSRGRFVVGIESASAGCQCTAVPRNPLTDRYSLTCLSCTVMLTATALLYNVARCRDLMKQREDMKQDALMRSVHAINSSQSAYAATPSACPSGIVCSTDNRQLTLSCCFSVYLVRSKCQMSQWPTLAQDLRGLPRKVLYSHPLNVPFHSPSSCLDTGCHAVSSTSLQITKH